MPPAAGVRPEADGRCRRRFLRGGKGIAPPRQRAIRKDDWTVTVWLQNLSSECDRGSMALTSTLGEREPSLRAHQLAALAICGTRRDPGRRYRVVPDHTRMCAVDAVHGSVYARPAPSSTPPPYPLQPVRAMLCRCASRSSSCNAEQFRPEPDEALVTRTLGNGKQTGLRVRRATFWPSSDQGRLRAPDRGRRAAPCGRARAEGLTGCWSPIFPTYVLRLAARSDG